MHECPYCGSDLIGSTGVHKRRRGDPTGSKSTGMEYISCPDCGEVIDGFIAH